MLLTQYRAGIQFVIRNMKSVNIILFKITFGHYIFMKYTPFTYPNQVEIRNVLELSIFFLYFIETFEL